MTISEDTVKDELLKYLESPHGMNRIKRYAYQAIDQISRETGETREQIISRYFGNISS